MLTGIPVGEVARILNNERETTLKEMKDFIFANGFCIDEERKEAKGKSDLPPVCLLSLDTPRCWHWSLYANGTFYDPEHGVMHDFPACSRKYYWEINSNSE